MNSKVVVFFSVVVTMALVATKVNSTSEVAKSEHLALCSAAWQSLVEKSVSTGDGAGHGPDVGSDEWKSVVEFKLGIRGEPNVLPRSEKAWCQHINQLIQNLPSSTQVNQTGPSFPCDKTPNGSIEALICQDPKLSELDRKLAEVYTLASSKVANEQPPSLAVKQLKAEQRGWLKGRNECWKSDDKRSCVLASYSRRTAELQAKYYLVAHQGPINFACDNNTANEVVVSFFQTQPLTLIAERGDSVALMYQVASADGVKYIGRNEMFWQQADRTLVRWGYNEAKMQCRQRELNG